MLLSQGEAYNKFAFRLPLVAEEVVVVAAAENGGGRC